MNDVIEPTFGAQLLTLPTIFEKRFFTIPDYQRGYAWDERQVDELLKDLDHLIDDGVAHRHYTGTLVLSRAADSSDGDFHVVDGQQRLTTVVIALRLLVDHLPADEQEKFAALYLRRGEAGADRAVLQLNSDTRQYFERVVLGNGHRNAIKLRAQFIIRPSRSSSKSEIFHSMGNSQNLCQHFEWNQEFSAISRVCCYTSCQPL